MAVDSEKPVPVIVSRKKTRQEAAGVAAGGRGILDYIASLQSAAPTMEGA